ncbi:MAG: hypothetical protein U5R46_08430 [Gammaproteobacteria bacterium]|nr:hypothetical protein [Gammaproteobacteria bacterium]
MFRLEIRGRGTTSLGRTTNSWLKFVLDNKEVWSQYRDYTRDLTAYARQLAFCGVAVVWILKAQDGSFSTYVLAALLFIVLFFLSDVLQFFVSAVLLRHWVYHKEAEYWAANKSLEGNYNKPKKLDCPASFFFGSKIVVLLIGLLLIGLEILSHQ